MKTPLSFCAFRLLTITLVGAFAFSAARAQQNAGDTLSFNNGNGGDGIWENGAAGTPWSDGAQAVDWDNSILTNASFGNTAGNVTVSGTVDVLNQTYNSNYTLTGGTIQNETTNQAIAVNNNSTVSIGSDLDLDTGYNNDQFDFDVNGTSSLTLGNVLYTNPTDSAASTGHRVMIFITNGAANINLTGTYSTGTSGVTGGIWMYGDGTSTLKLSGDYSADVGGPLTSIYKGTLLINTNKLGTNDIDASAVGSDTLPYAAVLTNGAYAVSNRVSLENIDFDNQTFGSVSVGGNTMDVSTFSGPIAMIQTGADLTAVDGGRVYFTGDIGGQTYNGITKSGAGTVVISNNNDYNLNNYFSTNTNPIAPGTVAADIKAGTLLITNTPTSGTQSAFGNNAGIVKVEAGATLGGTDTSTQQIVAESGTSIIAPGDAGQSNLHIDPTIGTLTLVGGLSTDDAGDGMTMDFKLNGFTNDVIEAFSLSLNGTITMNFTAFGAGVETDNPYRVIFGAVQSDGDPDFQVNAPTGYALDKSYGDGSGYVYTGSSFTVEFVAIPEPSTYAMMLGGFALLAFCVRRKLV